MKRALAFLLAGCGAAGPSPGGPETAVVARVGVSRSDPGAAPLADKRLPTEVGVDGHLVCVRLEDKVYCAFDNDEPLTRHLPIVSDAVSFTLHDRTLCFVRRGGDLLCGGQRGAVPPAPIREPFVVAEAALSTCELTRGRELWCWGMALLASQEIAAGEESREPVHVAELDGLTDLAAAEDVFCGVRDGGVLCWGRSYSLFPDFIGAAREPRRIEVPAAKRVRLGSTHACALTADGRVFCWGSSGSNALGNARAADGPVSNRPPEPVEGLPRAVDIAASHDIACAVIDGGDVYCWGRWPTGRVAITPERVRIRD